MFLHSFARWFGHSTPFAHPIPPDVGAGAGGGSDHASGAGAGAGAGGGGGQGAGAGAGAGGQGAAGGGTPAVYKMSADSLVDLGDGKPVKWGELTSGEKARFMPRKAYDDGVNMLLAAAKEFDARNNNGATRRAANDTTPPPDPFADYEGMAVVDGASAVKLAKLLRDQGLAPLAQMVTAMGKRMEVLEKQAKSHGATIGRYGAQDDEREFRGMVTDTLGTIQVKGMPEGVAITPELMKAHPVLNEIARDLWSSYEVGTIKPDDFSSMLSERLSGLFSLVRAIQDAGVKAAEDKTRKYFANPNKGGARPNGDPKYKFERGGELASRVFGTLQPARV